VLLSKRDALLLALLDDDDWNNLKPPGFCGELGALFWFELPF
jgi:hypothetical protein